MHLDINKYLLIFIGWLIRTSCQLECVQCTSPIRRVQQSWDHSCLDGTVAPLPCKESISKTVPSFKRCASAVYRLGNRTSAGVVIDRGCTNMHIHHGCDPSNSSIDLDTTLEFYCTRTCMHNGCNRHSVKEIIPSNGNEVFKSKFILLYFISNVFLFYFK